MLIVALLFIPRFVCAFAIALSIFSSSGFLHFLGAKLNATSMITLAISVGFSVDFASHITYSFMSVDSEDPKVKLSGALRSVAWPIVQTSIITLGTVQNQLVNTVFKAVLLVILFGISHALIYIPLLLLKLNQLSCFFVKVY
ncbi:Patched domain-containing protein 3 [Aphelenchoides bicaudatus]|nr:Patched domain-containing protein 3 [Aphelenchoides bicaudatus]